ncbi:hypothetical protein VTN02DRAFT_4825 [Thermoascus thermophilus]
MVPSAGMRDTGASDCELPGKRGGMYRKVDRAAGIAEKLEMAKSGTNKSGMDAEIIDRSRL